MAYLDHSELVIALRTVESPQQRMVSLAAFVFISLLNQFFLVLSSLGQLFEAIITKIDVVSSCIWLTTAAHRNVPCLSMASSTTAVAHETSWIAFTFILRLNILAHTLSVNILVWFENNNRVLVNGISCHGWGSGILFFRAISASMNIAREEIVVRVF